MRFIPNPLVIPELEAAEAYDEARKQIGESIKGNVEQIAPSGASGQYHDSIEVDDEGSVGTTDPFGHLVEWGSVNNPPYAPIRRGVELAGLRLEEIDK